MSHCSFAVDVGGFAEEHKIPISLVGHDCSITSFTLSHARAQYHAREKALRICIFLSWIFPSSRSQHYAEPTQLEGPSLYSTILAPAFSQLALTLNDRQLLKP